MKYIYILLIALLPLIPVQSQKARPKFSFSIGNWEAQLVSFDHLYPTYLADPLGVRFEVSIQNMLYSDFDPQDQINKGGGYKGKQVINPGVRVSLLKFSPKSNPKLGISVDLGATIPAIMRAGNNDLIGTDGIYYFAIAGKPTEWLSLRFTKHHICTHVGDEFPYGGVYSPIDFDPNITALPVRDDFIVSAAARPLWFLHDPQWDILQVYGEFGFFYPGYDFMGERSNKPHYEAYYNFQGGAELEYYFKNKYFGGIYTALNVSAYQLNAYAPNVSVTGGYIFPQERDHRRLRIGFNYYNGRSLSNQFYNRKERFMAFIVGFDI
ncbi:MAG: hypothetical protein WC699_11425 [Bacteroidales bacterium]|jgi:hypothetical protein